MVFNPTCAFQNTIDSEEITQEGRLRRPSSSALDDRARDPWHLCELTKCAYDRDRITILRNYLDLFPPIDLN
jgi:hypothetical protein